MRCHIARQLLCCRPEQNKLEAAISPCTACVLFFAGAHFAGGALPFDAIALNPQTVEPDEAEIVLDALRQVLAPVAVSAGVDGGR